MAPHSIGSVTISFGLVAIPTRMYSATSPGGVSFNMLHAKCGNRIKQQLICPVDNEVVDRSQIVKGYEFGKDQYVRFTDEELKQLEEENSRMLEIREFVPLESVDPIYFEKTYFLGPDKGGDKAYKLLADAMKKTSKVAVAKYVMRGKGTMVLIRPADGGLMLHTMFFDEEVRDFGEIDKGDNAKISATELSLAERLIDDLASKEFKPEQYHDEFRGKVLERVEAKVEGKEITAAAPHEQRAQVIDLMDALKQSLEGKSGASGKAQRQPASRAKRSSEATPKRKTASRR